MAADAAVTAASTSASATRDDADDVAALQVQLEQVMRSDPDKSLAVIAVMFLTDVISQRQAKTMSQLLGDLQLRADVLHRATRHSVSVAAGCQLFLRFVTRMGLDLPDLELCKAQLIQRGQQFVEHAAQAKDRIAQLGEKFIQDGLVLLVHSISRPVLKLLLKAAAANKRFTVYVTESRPTNSGYRLADHLTAAGIPCQVILDTAVAFFIQHVDLVLVGAEGVVENGGIINQIGTYQLAIVAKDAHKPFYVAVESYKFVREFPLSQLDVNAKKGHPFFDAAAARADQSPMRSPQPMQRSSTPSQLSNSLSDLSNASGRIQPLVPSVDYTPPTYITLLITDLGILTPSAVSDELIQLYG